MESLTEDFLSIVLNETPLLDVRAPVEFEKGAFKNAVNIPILEDEERHLVGIEYKKSGNEAAVRLARELIKEEGKEARTKKWLEWLESHPDAILYCFRGGQRSRIAQEWLKEAGYDITRIKGGYKAFRNYLIDESIRISGEMDTLIIGGRTGSGKTLLLEKVQNAIDLEKLANHRGSSFGGYAKEQNSQIGFENDLAYELIQKYHDGLRQIVIEHESKNIGRCYMPPEVYANLMNGRLILLTAPMQRRIEITHKEYVQNAIEEYTQEFGEEEGIERWCERTLFRLTKIRKRLGDLRYRTLVAIFENALQTYKKSGSLEEFKEFIEILLRDYYDPMYDYQIEKTSLPIVFEGDEAAVMEFLAREASLVQDRGS